MYGSIEGVMAHFKLVMEGVPVPAGEVYHADRVAPTASWAGTWSATARAAPTRCHVRAPGFQILSGMPRMCEGRMLADLVPTFDTINMIGGEVEQ